MLMYVIMYFVSDVIVHFVSALYVESYRKKLGLGSLDVTTCKDIFEDYVFTNVPTCCMILYKIFNLIKNDFVRTIVLYIIWPFTEFVIFTTYINAYSAYKESLQKSEA